MPYPCEIDKSLRKNCCSAGRYRSRSACCLCHRLITCGGIVTPGCVVRVAVGVSGPESIACLQLKIAHGRMATNDKNLAFECFFERPIWTVGGEGKKLSQAPSAHPRATARSSLAWEIGAGPGLGKWTIKMPRKVRMTFFRRSWKLPKSKRLSPSGRDERPIPLT